MTEFTETRALLAMLDNDEEELDRLLASMLPGERYALSVACRHLAHRAADFVPPSQQIPANGAKS